MAIRAPALTVDDQEYYPLHEEDDVPETPPHEAASRYARDALIARFPDWFITGNVCVYWEQGNTRDYRAPDVFVVSEPLTEPVTRVYQLWKQPPVAIAIEVGSRTSFRTDVGPKVEIYQNLVKAREYYHADLDHEVQRLWRLGPAGYEVVPAEPNGRLKSEKLGLEFALEEGTLRIYTLDGELLLTHEEEVQRRTAAEVRLEESESRRAVTERQAAAEAQRRRQAEQEVAAEAQRRRQAEQQATTEARQREEAQQRAVEAEARIAELERQLAALRPQSADGE
jgi:Uma2 family endonuclease